MEEQISTRSKLEITPRLIKAKLKTAFSCFIDGIVEIMFCDRVNSSAIKMDETKTMEQQQLYLKIFIFYYQTICHLSDFVMKTSSPILITLVATTKTSSPKVTNFALQNFRSLEFANPPTR